MAKETILIVEDEEDIQELIWPVSNILSWRTAAPSMPRANLGKHF